MPIEQIGTYHLANNPQLYEPQRRNTFEFVVADLDGIAMVGATNPNSVFRNAQEIIRCSVVGAPVPHFTQSTVEVKRGNTTMKFAGTPTFDAGQITFNDFIGANTKEILMAWQNLSYNVKTEKVSALARTNYKKDCYLIEYAPDFVKVRQWVLHGCWISGISEDDYNSESSDKKTIQATIQYDWAELDTTGLDI